MAFNDAIKFFDRIKKDENFRESLYLCNSITELDNHIKNCNYNFTLAEIEDAYRSILLKCQAKNDAESLTEIFNMYRMLIGINLIEID